MLSGVVMLIGPDVAPTGTVASTSVGEMLVKLIALVPLNETSVAPLSVVPNICTTVPAGPTLGVKLLIFGSTLKLESLSTVPPGA
jgi:hypothetical protein